MTDNNKIQANSVDNNKIQANLTEQWKKGELPEGLYWVKHDGVINILDDLEISLTNVEQILAPVPSYDELQNMNKAVNECMSANIKLVEENAQFKELLKECELWFTGIVDNMNDKNVGEHNRNLPIGNFEYIFKVFSQKIKEVLK